MAQIYDNARQQGEKKMLKDIIYWETVFQSQSTDYEKMIAYKIRKLKEFEQIELIKLSLNQVQAMKLMKREIQLLVGFLAIMEHLKDSYLLVTSNNVSLFWTYWTENLELSTRINQLQEENEFWLKQFYTILKAKKEETNHVK
jgi:hypothetical protein